MNKELMEALDVLEKEKEISKETLFEAIENSLMTACKNHFGKADNVHVEINRETCDFLVYAEKEVVPTKDDVEDDCLQIALEDAQEISKKAQVGDMLHVEIKSKEFGRIATQNAKNVILQKIREEERSVIYNQYYEKEKDVVTGVVQRYVGKNISINLGKADAMLTENEQVKGEVFKPTERIKVYIVEVKNTPKGPRINVSRTHPELVKRLFESADLFPGFRPKNILIGVLQGFFRQFVLTHVYKEIRFHQNLIIYAVYIVVGMMMGDQILYPLGNFSGKAKLCQQLCGNGRAFFFL